MPGVYCSVGDLCCHHSYEEGDLWWYGLWFSSLNWLLSCPEHLSCLICDPSVSIDGHLASNASSYADGQTKKKSNVNINIIHKMEVSIFIKNWVYNMELCAWWHFGTHNLVHAKVHLLVHRLAQVSSAHRQYWQLECTRQFMNGNGTCRIWSAS